MVKKILICIAAIAFITACAPSQLEREFGASVRHNNDLQTWDRGAATNPDPNPPGDLDGPYGQAVLSVYRDTLGRAGHHES